MKPDFLRSRQRRKTGRWFHYYRRNDKEISLGVHGLLPSDPRVLAAYWAKHAHYEEAPRDKPEATPQTLAWGIDIYQTSDHWKSLAEETRKNRDAIFKRYRTRQGHRPLSEITQALLQEAMDAKEGFVAVNHMKTLKPLFKHLKRIKVIATDPAAGVAVEKPKSKGFATTTADEIEAFTAAHKRGTRLRLIFDLAFTVGASRVDLVRLGRHNMGGGLIRYDRHKTGVPARVPITPDFLAAIEHCPDIAPTFILDRNGRPMAKESIGNEFGKACSVLGIESRLHGLRKAFCCYHAERGATAHQIAAMAGHLTLSEVERYTAAADREKIVRALMDG